MLGSYDEVVSVLSTGEHTIWFTKLTTMEPRIMRCTLDLSLIPTDNHPDFDIDYLPNNPEDHDDLISVWDLDKNAWRSFKHSLLTWYE